LVKQEVSDTDIAHMKIVPLYDKSAI